MCHLFLFFLLFNCFDSESSKLVCCFLVKVRVFVYVDDTYIFLIAISLFSKLLRFLTTYSGGQMSGREKEYAEKVEKI